MNEIIKIAVSNLYNYKNLSPLEFESLTLKYRLRIIVDPDRFYVLSLTNEKGETYSPSFVLWEGGNKILYCDFLNLRWQYSTKSNRFVRYGVEIPTINIFDLKSILKIDIDKRKTAFTIKGLS